MTICPWQLRDPARVSVSRGWIPQEEFEEVPRAGYPSHGWRQDTRSQEKLRRTQGWGNGDRLARMIWAGQWRIFAASIGGRPTFFFLLSCVAVVGCQRQNLCCS